MAAGTAPERLVRDLRAYAKSQRTVYHEVYLRPLWEQPGATLGRLAVGERVHRRRDLPIRHRPVSEANVGELGQILVAVP